MQVSRDDGTTKGKTVAQVSSTVLKKRIGARLCRLGVKVARKVKDLGVQFIAGQRDLVALERQQTSLEEACIRSFVRGGSAGWRSAKQCGATPSFTYGSSAASCPAGLVKQLRTYTA